MELIERLHKENEIPYAEQVGIDEQHQQEYEKNKTVRRLDEVKKTVKIQTGQME